LRELHSGGGLTGAFEYAGLGAGIGVAIGTPIAVFLWNPVPVFVGAGFGGAIGGLWGYFGTDHGYARGLEGLGYFYDNCMKKCTAGGAFTLPNESGRWIVRPYED
jgi:hypothetical protein